MILNSIIKLKITKITLLTSEIVSVWASKPAWYWREAINLSIGCSPENSSEAEILSEEDAETWGTKVRNRTDESERAMLTGELPFIKIRYAIDDEKIFPAFHPLEFVKWLQRSNLPHPAELFDAVSNHYARNSFNGNQTNYIFHKKLQAWEVRFGDETLDALKDLLGMTYIQLLIQHTDQPVDVLALEGLAGCHENSYSPDSDDDNDGVDTDIATRYDDGLNIYTETEDQILDDEARRQYQEELADLRDQHVFADETGNTSEAARIMLQIEAIKKELNAATGLGGRSRRLNSTTDKCRKRISKSIRQTIANIRFAEETLCRRDAVIAEHFTRCITTGVTCCYNKSRNNPPIEWTV